MRLSTQSFIISTVFGFLIVIPGHIGVVEGQLSDSTNVSKLGSLTDTGNNMILENRTVEYIKESKGYLVYPISSNDTISEKLPGVVMIHEWWGLNDNIKAMANILAKQGYVVLAADLYRGDVADTRERAMELVQEARTNQNGSVNNLQSAVKYLAMLPNVDGSKIVSLGWCFGGGQSLQLALNSQDYQLAATILYYGTPLITDMESLSKIKWPVLGIFGDKDQSIPLEEVNQFRNSLDQNGITNEIYIYNGVGHAFANPSGDNYAPKETEDAWQKTLTFLKKFVVDT